MSEQSVVAKSGVALEKLVLSPAREAAVSSHTRTHKSNIHDTSRLITSVTDAGLEPLI